MHLSRERVLGPVAGGLALLVATAGCTAPGISGAGFAEPTVTLSLGVADNPGAYSWELAEDFARRVDSATSGTVRVEVTNEGTEVARWNQRLAQRAIDGEFHLAMVQAQTWDALGVDSLTPLYVPGLLTDEEVLDAVATDELAGDLLSGLDGTGVTGLALVPGGLRHAFVDGGEALLKPADLAARGIRVAYSEVVWETFDALGARPSDPNGTEVEARLRDGSITVVDSTFALSDNLIPAPVTAGDVVTYPLAFTLVAHDGTLDDLSAQHRDALHDAARKTVEWAAQTRRPEADEALALCERNPRARVVLAGRQAVEEWRRAGRSVASALRAEPGVEALATQIEAVGLTVEPAEPVVACQGSGVGPDGPAATTPPPPNVPVDFPEGVYRKEVTAQELIEAGVNATDAHGHAGVWMLGLRDGVMMDPTCPGSTYEVVDDRIVITLGPRGETCGTAAGRVLFSAGWQLEGDQLTFTDVRSGHGTDQLMRGLFGTAPWTKIE